MKEILLTGAVMALLLGLRQIYVGVMSLRWAGLVYHWVLQRLKADEYERVMAVGGSYGIYRAGEFGKAISLDLTKWTLKQLAGAETYALVTQEEEG